MGSRHYSTQDAAQAMGASELCVRELAIELKVGRRGSTGWVFTEDELMLLVATHVWHRPCPSPDAGT